MHCLEVTHRTELCICYCMKVTLTLLQRHGWHANNVYRGDWHIVVDKLTCDCREVA